MVGAQGYRRFPLSKPRVSRNIALHAAPADRTYAYLASAFTIPSTSFFSQTSLIITNALCYEEWFTIFLAVAIQRIHKIAGHILFHLDVTLHSWLSVNYVCVCLCVCLCVCVCVCVCLCFSLCDYVIIQYNTMQYNITLLSLEKLNYLIIFYCAVHCKSNFLVNVLGQYIFLISDWFLIIIIIIIIINYD